MKKLNILSYFFLFITFIYAYPQNSRKDYKINVYYFHFTTRCITCKTVEEEAKKNLEILYPNLIKKGIISFQSINLDVPESKALAERYKIGGQSLIITKGDTKIDITREGFLYARNNPEKLKAVIKEKVDVLLNSK